MADYPQNKRSRPERRDGVHRDILLQVLTLLGVVTAVVTVTSLILLTMAQPSSWSRINTFNLSHWWDPRLLRYFFYLMIFGLMCSSLGIAINMKRMKRKYDSIRVNLVFMWLFSFIGIVVYIATQ